MVVRKLLQPSFSKSAKIATMLTAKTTDARKLISGYAMDAVGIFVPSVGGAGAVNYTATNAMRSHTMTDRDRNTWSEQSEFSLCSFLITSFGLGQCLVR